ncbi:15320_t:CDS:2, partial [Acaulospora colombiana]
MVKQKDVHRLFKQAMISRRCVTEELATILWKKCEEACRSLNENIPSQFEAAEIGTYIQEINDTITPLSLEFKSRIDEVTGKRMWALIELVVLAPADAYSVSSLAAIREVSNMKASMTKSQAEAALSNFVANGWLYRSDRGRYALSTRSLIELEIYLRRTYENDVPECSYCTELVTLGVACNNDDQSCRAVLHRHCYDLLRRSPNNFKCPLCKADWAQGGA